MPFGLSFHGRMEPPLFDRLLHILHDIEAGIPIRPEDRHFLMEHFGREVMPHEVDEVRMWMDEERRMW
jgi:hypothetical protein